MIHFLGSKTIFSIFNVKKNIVFIISNRVSDLRKILFTDSLVNFILIIGKLNFEKITRSQKTVKQKKNSRKNIFQKNRALSKTEFSKQHFSKIFKKNFFIY